MRTYRRLESAANHLDEILAVILFTPEEKKQIEATRDMLYEIMIQELNP